MPKKKCENEKTLNECHPMMMNNIINNKNLSKIATIKTKNKKNKNFHSTFYFRCQFVRN